MFSIFPLKCSPVPTTNTSSDVLAVIPDGKTKEESEEAAKKEIPVDSAQPSTTIQVRLTDGSTLVARLNHSHTVGDLRRYINMYPLLFSSFPSPLIVR